MPHSVRSHSLFVTMGALCHALDRPVLSVSRPRPTFVSALHRRRTACAPLSRCNVLASDTREEIAVPPKKKSAQHVALERDGAVTALWPLTETQEPYLANLSLIDSQLVMDVQHQPASPRKTFDLRAFVDRRPMLLKSLSMGITYGLADITAQLFAAVATGEVVPLANRLRRSLSLMLVGCVAVGPLLAVWFDFLERFIPGRSPKAIGARTALDQSIQVPVMIAIIFTLSSLAEGHSIAFCVEKCREKLVPTWRDCLCVWPIAQVINQGIVPLKHRVYFQALVSLYVAISPSYTQFHYARVLAASGIRT